MAQKACNVTLRANVDEIREQTKVLVGPQGRVVIPAEFRRILGLEPGATLIARIESGRLVLEKRENILARLKARFAKIPTEVSLAEELIAERQETARREAFE
jgi:AbrB family looped-hinge helix DNA binding protein